MTTDLNHLGNDPFLMLRTLAFPCKVALPSEYNVMKRFGRDPSLATNHCRRIEKQILALHSELEAARFPDNDALVIKLTLLIGPRISVGLSMMDPLIGESSKHAPNPQLETKIVLFG